LYQRVAAGKEPNGNYHRANAWLRSRGDGTNLSAFCRKRIRRFKEISALSITIAGFGARKLGPSHWIKIKNPNRPAVKREAEEDWGK
jgi:hypothetical protein